MVKKMTEQQRRDFEKVIAISVVGAIIVLLIPILPNGAEVSKRTLLWTRIAGVILILIGVFTRVHI